MEVPFSYRTKMSNVIAATFSNVYVDNYFASGISTEWSRAGFPTQ